MRRAAERALVALAGGLAGAVLAYAALRAIDAAFFPEPNPAAVVWTERSALVWRSAIALYAGGMIALGTFALAVRAPEAAARWLGRLVVLSACALVVVAALLP